MYEDENTFLLYSNVLIIIVISWVREPTYSGKCIYLEVYADVGNKTCSFTKPFHLCVCYVPYRYPAHPKAL